MNVKTRVNWKKTLAQIFKDHPDWKAPEYQSELENRLKAHAPGLSSVQKELIGLRKKWNETHAHGGLDTPWHMGLLRDYPEIYPEAVEYINFCMKYRRYTLHKYPETLFPPITIRQARWIARLCKFPFVFTYPGDKALSLSTIRREIKSALSGKENKQTASFLARIWKNVEDYKADENKLWEQIHLLVLAAEVYSSYEWLCDFAGKPEEFDTSELDYYLPFVKQLTLYWWFKVVIPNQEKFVEIGEYIQREKDGEA